MSRAAPAAPATTAPPALVADSLATLEQQIGGRALLVAALAHAPKSADLTYLLGLVGDPRSLRIPLADLCARGGVTAGELLDAYKHGVVARAQALALTRVSEQLEAVAVDTMIRALPQTAACTDCDGTGTHVPEPTKQTPNPHPAPCGACRGTGSRVYQGDLEHKKLALEMGKLLPKGGGLNLQVNQQANTFVGGAAGGSLERLQAASDAILFGDGLAPPDPTLVIDPGGEDVVDAVVVPRPPALDAPVLEGDWREDQQP